MEIQTLFSVTLFIIFSIAHTVLCVETCKPTSCSPLGPIVRFPFRLGHQPRPCGFPGFDLSCNNQSQLIINLNFAGDFEVSDIDYTSQTIYIKPEFCPPTRINAFNPSESPFDVGLLDRYLFFNCSSSAWFFPGVEVVKCFPGGNGTVVAVPRSFSKGFINRGLTESCQYNININVTNDILVGLQWFQPFCKRCEIEKGSCGYKNVETMEIGCSVPSTGGLSKAAKYGIIVGAGFPGILLLICLARKKINDRTHIQLQHRVQNLPTTTISVPPTRYVMGLDKVTIDSYPMTVLGESKRLPNPSDSTCAICLSEYQPNDTLRTVPECNHYFHSNCIDEWLKLNATCPVCRNFPEGSSGRAATDPISSSSSPTSLFSD